MDSLITFQLIYTVCERLLELAKKGSSLQKQLEKVQRSHSDLKATFSSISSTSTLTPKSNSPVQQSASKDSLVEKKRKKKSLLAVRARQRSISMEDLADDKFKSVLDKPDPECQSLSSSNSGMITPDPLDDDDGDEDDDNSIVFGNSVTDLRAASSSGYSSNHSSKHSSTVRNVGQGMNGRQPSPHSDLNSHTETSNWSIDQSVATMEMSEECVQKVAYALSADRIEDYVRERASRYEVVLAFLYLK